jgi:hypothetical protein
VRREERPATGAKEIIELGKMYDTHSSRSYVTKAAFTAHLWKSITNYGSTHINNLLARGRFDKFII